MHNEPIRLPWAASDWFENASAWIEGQLQSHGWHITAPIELIHQRPWSSFARIVTDNGVAYFKAPAPMFSYEAGLAQALASWRPDCSVPLLGIDLERGWILSADAGITLRQVTRSVDQIPHWLHVMPLYAELQIELIDRVPELLALGLPDRRLEQLPQLYAQVLEDTETLRIGLEDGLTPEEYQRLRDGQAHFAAQCEQLAAYKLPATLTHEEVHENNVLLGDGRYIFTDWSDCSVGHPFFTMLVTLRAAAHWLQLDESGPELRQVRDAYLEPWTRFAPHEDLLQALALAYRLGMVNRALSWHHGLSRLSEHDKAEYADSVPGWLQDYLQAEAGEQQA
ncbi:MAG: phosphotransferase [Chloroflexi bacterium]|nr:phosphotransferase [Chloroflexota bacterium]